MQEKKFDLEDRLVNFTCMAPTICDMLPNTKAGNNLEHQLSKSSSSAALNYGEVQGAESKADFIHKMKVCLKELRESRINLRIIIQKPLLKSEIVEKTLQECNELIGIFSASINTVKKNSTSN
jgi:four helix bundle protein